MIVEFEPVGTHPDHRKLGLAKSIILEGLKRLKSYNPSIVCIPGAAVNEGAVRLYDSLGFAKEDVVIWRKYL
jgi:ribosomal protein S18 acetylase RimI-like enzyme